MQKAAWFYQLICYSYASGLTSFGSQPHDIGSNFPLIEQTHRRLTKVVIENKDFEKLIGQYDRPVSFFYCDPPYFEIDSSRINNIKQRYDDGAQFPEILIANYDMQERSCNALTQINLFDLGIARSLIP